MGSSIRLLHEQNIGAGKNARAGLAEDPGLRFMRRLEGYTNSLVWRSLGLVLCRGSKSNKILGLGLTGKV